MTLRPTWPAWMDESRLARRGEQREEEVLEVAFASDRLACVSARMTMMGRDFHDFLTLVRHGAEWRIVAKVFSYVPRKD
ncbi:nuclear transport factor 2 family protein [Phaeobacter sp. BS34]